MKKFLFIAATLLTALMYSGAQAGELGVFQSGSAGFDTRTYWYDDGKEVTVIDTQFVPSLSEAMVAKIRKTTKNPITRIIVTHPNPDKFNGLSVFHKLGATSIASKATADAMPGVNAYKRYFWIKIAGAFTDKTYPEFQPVKETFSGRKTIKLKSGETITLIELANSGVSSTQTVVRIDATGDLLVGDLVHNNAHAWLEGGIVNGKATPDINAWIAALDELKTLGGKTVRGGRGNDAPVGEAVLQQQAYLKTMDKLVTDYIAGLDEAGRKELSDPTLAKKHYAALQVLATSKFPDFKLPYMVGYGIYGLVNSKL